MFVVQTRADVTAVTYVFDGLEDDAGLRCASGRGRSSRGDQTCIK
jgi:hypothetical protein